MIFDAETDAESGDGEKDETWVTSTVRRKVISRVVCLSVGVCRVCVGFRTTYAKGRMAARLAEVLRESMILWERIMLIVYLVFGDKCQVG